MLPDKYGIIFDKFSLYSLSTLRPNAKDITLFLPNRNLKFKKTSNNFQFFFLKIELYLLSDHCCLKSLRNKLR